MPQEKKTFNLIIKIIVLLALIGIAVTAFTLSRVRERPPEPVNRLRVAASFYPLFFFAQEIGGDKAQAINITPAGTEPHDYEPTAGDLVKIKQSRLLVINGGGLETWADNIKQNIDAKRLIMVVAGQGLITRTAAEAERTVTDPHIWLDPLLAKQMVEKILSGFIQADAVNRDYYQANAAALSNQLAELDQLFRQELESCRNKNMVVSHAAFGYLTAAYGLNQLPLTGISPDTEPGARQLAAIAQFAKDHQVKYIFFESLASPKLAQTLAKEVGAKTLRLNPLEGLIAEEQAQGKNYFTVMRDNLANLKIALDCQ